MEDTKTISTERLILEALTEDDHSFIQELLNTEGWIKFIGNRNIYSKEDAVAYIQKINGNPATDYRAVRIAATGTPVGLVTLIQRDYLDQPDIGFAFLPAYAGKGYASEASGALLSHIMQDEKVHAVHAVTLPGNNSSVALIKKLGLSFDKTIRVDEEELHLYTIKKDAG